MPEETTVWISDYEEVLETLKHPGLRMASYDGAKSTIFADVLITLDGDDHLVRRRLESVLVRPAIVRLIEHDLVPAAARSLIQPFVARGAGDLVELAKLISTSMAARVVGLDIGEDVEGLQALASLMARLHKGVVIEWTNQPRELVLADVRLALAEYRERFFRPALGRRQETAASENIPSEALDLIQLLVLKSDQGCLDDELILRESVHYLAATAHTSAMVMVHAFHDIWGWLADHDSDVARLGDAVFVRRCIHETMRLRPPSGWAYRVATEPLRLRTGRLVSKGQRLALNLTEASRDPSVFGSHADRFDPTRPLPAHAASYGLAFGAGPHVCLGKRLAAGHEQNPEDPGTLTASLLALLSEGCRPHPEQPPLLEEATLRHQYRSYPVVFFDRQRAASDASGPATDQPA